MRGGDVHGADVFDGRQPDRLALGIQRAPGVSHVHGMHKQTTYKQRTKNKVEKQADDRARPIRSKKQDRANMGIVRSGGSADDLRAERERN